MNLSKWLMKQTKKMAKSAVKDMKAAVKPTKKKSSSRINDGIDLCDEFEKKHGKECDRLERKIWNIDTNDMERNPDKIVAAYEKQKELAKELEDLCRSHGKGGIEFYDMNYGDMYAEIQRDLDDYMKDGYEDDKEYYEEMKADAAAVKKAKDQIIKSIQSSGGSAMQKDLKKNISVADRHYNRAVDDLVSSGKIIRSKEGNYVRLSLA